MDNEMEIYNILLDVCADNKKYFENRDGKSRKLSAAFVLLEEQIESILPLLREFRTAAPLYDFKKVSANGYRSFIIAIDKFARISLKISQNVYVNRTSLFFHKSHYIKEIQSCCRIFASYTICFQLLQLLRTSAEPTELFLNKIETIGCIENFSKKVNIQDFFGKFLGFQYGETTQPIVKTIAIMITAFAEYYYNKKNVIQFLALCSQFFANPDLRAKRMAQIIDYQFITPEFCQTFLNMSEHDLMKKMNILFFPASAVNELIELRPEPIQYKCDNSVVDIPIPSAYIGLKSLNVRLISSVKREGMEHLKKNAEKNNVMPPSDWLIFHLHGGGFISHTSESHQVYLKEWTTWIDAPIVSVDYSLAPEAPFPRALEDVLYAYVWVLNNIRCLGTTAKRIVFAGDSAGGNLCISLIFRCVDLNVRKPDGLFLAYTPTVLQFYPCPSRFLGLMDPLLSFGFMMNCTKAYVHIKKCTSSKSDSFVKYDNKSLEDFAEKNSVDSQDSDPMDSTKTISSSSFAEYVSDSEENSIESDLISESEPTEEISLPTKYKHIIKGFVSNLKEKYLSKNQKLHNRNTFYSNISSIEQLISEVQDNQFLSPVYADDKYFQAFPPTSILTVEMDPCIDDCVTFAKKLDKLNVHVHLDVLKNMCHGFLNFSLANKEAFDGSLFCAGRIKELLSGTLPKQ